MSKRLLLAGLGMQGQAALHDLLTCGAFSRITVADTRPDLEVLLSRYPPSRITPVHLDAADEREFARLLGQTDLVVEALPAALVLRTGLLAASCGIPLVSSMFYSNPEGLDAAALEAQRRAIAEVDRKAKETGVPILSECGMDPGLDLLMAKRAISELDQVQVLHTYGAGLPDAEARTNPLRYKFSWSPVGVMRAYSRPSTAIRDGQAVEIPARDIFEWSNYEIIDAPEIGPLECFLNGDAVHYANLLGIRPTLRQSCRYTARYSGHCAFWNTMVKSGFLGTAPVAVGGAMVAPLDFTAALLSSQQQFQYAPGERDLVYIRIDARGLRGARRQRILYELLDYRDLATGFTAMQRTVGLTLSRAAQLVATGRVTTPGLLTALDLNYDDILPALEPHGIKVRMTHEDWA